MVYTVAITKTGQMTLPKALRVFLGVDGAKTVQIEKQKNRIVIQRKPTKEEYYADMDKHISAETRKIIEEEAERGGMPPVREMMKEISESPEKKAYWRRKYGF